MRRTFIPAFVLTLLATAHPAKAEGPPAFDPTDYLRQQELEQQKRREVAAIHPSNAVIGGVPYVKIETDKGVLYVPKLPDLTVEDLDRALCSDRFKASELSAAIISNAEANLAAKIQLYAPAVMAAVYAKCAGPAALARKASQTARPLPSPDLEIGTRAPEDNYEPATYSIFHNDLAPNIGLRTDF